MALRKILSGRFLHISKRSCTRAGHPPQTPDLQKVLACCTTAGASNRRTLLQRRSISQSGAVSAVPLTSTRNALPAGDKLIERIRSSITKDRIRIESFAAPLREKEKGWARYKMEISVADLRILCKELQVEAVRAKLRGSREYAREIAAPLDHSGAVIVLEDVAFLRPEQVARANERVITQQPIAHGDELKELEAEKAVIDRKAEAEVKRELWAGLGLLLFQTAGFMRLTFWDLSWDVMEPVCFFTTSLYFMLGYAFFLRTAKEPSFEGFFSSRFAAKQKRLMKSRGFDLSKYSELKRALLIHSGSSARM